jgi:hypothetical protein
MLMSIRLQNRPRCYRRKRRIDDFVSDYFVSLAKKRATERALMSGLVRSMTSGRIPFGMQQLTQSIQQDDRH